MEIRGIQKNGAIEMKKAMSSEILGIILLIVALATFVILYLGFSQSGKELMNSLFGIFPF